MKYRKDYRLAKGFFILTILFVIAVIKGSFSNQQSQSNTSDFNVYSLVFFSPFIIGLLTAAFLKTRTYSIDQSKLQTNCIFGLFPKEYKLSKISQVKVEEWNPPGQVSGFYTLITLSYRYRIIKTIKIDFEDGSRLKVDGQTIEQEDYKKLIKILKK